MKRGRERNERGREKGTESRKEGRAEKMKIMHRSILM